MIRIIRQETIQFFVFVILGMVFSIIFDFFRALRKNRKISRVKVYIQDIIYFLIVGFIFIIVMLNYTNAPFRLYLLIGIILGITFYIGVFGNHILNIFVKLLNFYHNILEFIFLPLYVYGDIFKKQIYFLKKFVLNCCKKISYMVNSKYELAKTVLLRPIIKINKRGKLNVKKCKGIQKEI